MKRLVLPVLLCLSACGPMSMAEAERQCFERARLAQKPRGEISVGATSDGRRGAAVELEITSDYLLGKDPSAVYESCVMSKTGQAPSRPLYMRPDWTG
ncbi:hypothetical protein [Tabrizicola sp.]|jgi:hypothetical protein|uniref:hypothetical protein n=1 Tax=Tabrizicola sp. TaxID=2005166 RepID=UPI001A63130A|nr:hypothetical protein [Tabrizicola sp.]MBL9064365.1 hypothetical protein [Tabrizicola sp.]